MPSKCVECDHLLVGDEVGYLNGKSYCDDCYRANKKAVYRRFNLMVRDPISWDEDYE
jgi:hypothetical protein